MSPSMTALNGGGQHIDHEEILDLDQAQVRLPFPRTCWALTSRQG